METRRLLDPTNISASAYKRLLKTYGAKNDYELVALAAASGARIGTRENTQIKNAIKFFANKYNAEIEAAKERAENERIIRRLEEERVKIASKYAQEMKKSKAKAEAQKKKFEDLANKANISKNVFFTAHFERTAIMNRYKLVGENKFVLEFEAERRTNTIMRSTRALCKSRVMKEILGIEKESRFVRWADVPYEKESDKQYILKNLLSDGAENMNKPFIETYTRHVAKKSNIMKEPIREPHAVDLNGIIPNSTWCKDRGMCVVDWLKEKYHATKGHIKSVKSDEHIEFLSTYWVDESTTRKEVNNCPNRDGYTLENIQLFCRNTGKTLIALHDGEIIIDERVKSCEDPLVFEFKNNHLYPITDNGKIRSLTHRGIVSCFKGLKVKDKKPKEALPLVFLDKKERDMTSVEFLCHVIAENKIQPYGEKLRMTNGRLHNFEIKEKIYCPDPENEHIKAYCNMINIPYTGQPVVQFVTPFLAKLPKSQINEEIRKALYIDGVKHRTHYGLYNEGEMINTSPEFCSEHIGLDFNKFYRNIMTSPLDDWMTLDPCATIQNVTTFNGEFGLWFVETSDMSLMHKTNWYTNNVIQRATEMNIEFTPRYFIKGQRNGKTLLSDIINEMADCFQDANLTKLAINSISGYLGQTESKSTILKIDENVNRVWDTFMKHQKNIDNMIYHVSEPDENGRRTHIYGNESRRVKLDTNLPMYMQILDWANMQLNDAILKHGGYERLIFRKTDEFVMKRMDNHDYEFSTDNLTGLKESELDARQFKYLPREPVEFKFSKKKWKQIESISCSDDNDELICMLEKGKSLMISSEAGTGKSYMIHKVAEKLPIIKIAFTNKAANNIGGMTIHKFLGIDQVGEINIGEVIRNASKFKAIVIDEYSMIPLNIWQLLYRVKQETQLPFLVCGDYHQLPPVETDGRPVQDYCDHPNVMHICGYRRTELQFTEKCRYNKPMAKYLQRIWHEDPSLEINVEKPTAGSHICFSNARRKEINSALNKTGKLISYEGPANKYNEDIRLAVGTKLLSLASNDKHKIVKSETYIVSEVGDLTFKIDDREIPINQIHSLFCLAYCITVHKAQGMTISGKLNIHEIETIRKDRRMFYTAVSRATAIENIVYVS